MNVLQLLSVRLTEHRSGIYIFYRICDRQQKETADNIVCTRITASVSTILIVCIANDYYHTRAHVNRHEYEWLSANAAIDQFDYINFQARAFVHRN